MDPSEISDLLAESIYDAIEKEIGIEKASINGAVARHIESLANRTAEELAKQYAQLTFELFEEEEETELQLDNKAVHPNNKLNELPGANWLYSTISVVRTSYPSILGHQLRKRQGGNKPPQLMQDLIEFFTKSDGVVLDPFAGAGGTALGAYLAGRESVNIELNPDSVSIYKEVCRQEGIEPHEFIQGDCRDVLPTLGAESFDFIATDPPYSPELKRTMSGESESIRYGRRNRKSGYVSYSDDYRDLSKSESFSTYFDALVNIGEQLLRVLKPKKYMAMILRDSYQDGHYVPTSGIIGQRYSELGWVLKGEKIWYATGTRIRPYGYPNAFVPNIIHQSILIFRKE